MGGIIEARAGRILKFGGKRREEEKKKKKAGSPAYRMEQEAARGAGTLREGDLEAT